MNDFDTWFNDAVLKGVYNFKAGNAGDSAKTGLIVARLNNNPRFEELFHLWMEGLQREGKFGTYLEPLKVLKEYLNANSVS